MHVPLALVGFPAVGLLLGRFCSSLDREDIRFELPVRVRPPFSGSPQVQLKQRRELARLRYVYSDKAF